MKKYFIFTYLYALTAKFRNVIELLKKSQEYPCRVEEIDIVRKQVVIYCHGSRPTVYLPISDTVSDMSIISNLPPIQASWVGYFYGKLYWETLVKGGNHIKMSKTFTLGLSHSKGRYKLIGSERNGDLSYVDTIDKKLLTENPAKMLMNKHLIQRFDSSQACYIGILAGINISQHGLNILNDKKISHLRIIK